MFAKFLKDESGATAIEYGILAALIGVVLAGGATVLGTQISTLFSNIGTALGSKSTSI